MKSWLSVGLTVAFLSTSTVALVPDANAFDLGRVVRGAVGAVATGATFVAPFVSRAYVTAEWNAMYAVGISPAAGMFVLPTVIAVGGGFGVYALTRAIVGNGPEGWRNGLPGIVAGSALMGLAAYGIAAPIAIGGVAALGAISLAGPLIFAGVGLGFLAYGAYRWWKASHAKSATQPTTNGQQPPAQPPVATPGAGNGNGVPTPQPQPPTHGPHPIPFPIPHGSGVQIHSGPAGSNVSRNDATSGRRIPLPASSSSGPNQGFAH